MSIHRKCKHGIVLYPHHVRTDAEIVVTTLDDRVVDMHPVGELHNAVDAAIRLADKDREQPAVVRVACWPFVSLCWGMGIDPHSLNITRSEVSAALKTVLLEAQEPAVRRGAYDQLVKMGEMR